MIGLVGFRVLGLGGGFGVCRALGFRVYRALGFGVNGASDHSLGFHLAGLQNQTQ